MANTTSAARIQRPTSRALCCEILRVDARRKPQMQPQVARDDHSGEGGEEEEQPGAPESSDGRCQAGQTIAQYASAAANW